MMTRDFASRELFPRVPGKENGMGTSMGCRLAACVALVVLVGAGCASAPTTKETPMSPAEAQAPSPSAEAAAQTPGAPTAGPAAQRPARAGGEVAPRALPEAQAPLPKAGFTCPSSDPVTPRRHWLSAVNDLQSGDTVAAKKELRLALCQDPENKTALSLLKQIEEPPEDLFGGQWSEYTVQPGDTLSKIAERFLGDPLLFYGLARYNRIENPSRLKAGEVVRVPKSSLVPPPASAEAPQPETKPAPVPPKEEVPPPTDRRAPTVQASPEGGTYSGAVAVTLSAKDETDPSPVIHYTLDGSLPTRSSPVYENPVRLAVGTTSLRFMATDAAGNVSPVHSETYTVSPADPYAGVRKQIDAGDYERAIEELEKTPTPEGRESEARALLVSACTKYADALSEQGNLAEAEKVLQKAAAAAPEDAGVRSRLQQLQQREGAEQLYQSGLQAAQAGDLDQALSDFQKVLAVEPDNALARQKADETRKELVEAHSRQALAAFRRQDLDEAIAEWDRVLALDPGNELAKLRRAEAEDLKARFEQKFENQPEK